MADFSRYSNKDEVKAISESQSKFAKDLYLTLAKASKGNLFFSPFSIATAVSMVHMGSKENTEAQIRSALHLPIDKALIKKGFQDLIADYKKKEEIYELSTANMAYISHQFSLLEDFESSLTNDFLSTSKVVNFGNPEPVRKEINDAVEKETNSKIKELIPSGILNDLTRLVLVNAIYFKGLWTHQFDKKDTKPLPFWVSADQSVDTPMMNVEKEFRIAHHRDLDASLLALDYKGDRMSFVILLPNKRDGLSALEEKLEAVDIGSLDSKTSKIKIKVTIPKFKLEETVTLNETLKSMGMTDLFSPSECDLSGVAGTKDLYVSHVLHKAFLNVDEEGSEAAAATAAIVMTRCLIRPMPPFVADHPFVFYIKDKFSNALLFMGKYVEP